MEKIKVKVCMGTTCFVMGGASLQELINIIPIKYGDKVVVEGASCLEKCYENSSYSKAPYVQIDNEIVEEATVEKVLEIINSKLG